MADTPDKSLESLHAKLAEVLYDEVTAGEPSASILNVARQFLKDNHIEGAAEEGTPVGNLAQVLPFTTPKDEQGN